MKTFYALDRKTWRKWLLKNHKREKEVWLIKYHKSSGKPCVSYETSVEETLCFGWIDSIQKAYDKESSIQRFSPRKPKSNCSENNRALVKRLIEQGLMTKSGLEILPDDL